MREVFLVFIGSGIGGVLRFLLGSMVYSYAGQRFPYGTILVNLSGSLVIGVMYYLISMRYLNLAPYLSSLILVGILGGYTTFSTFSIDTIQLIKDDKILFAGLNILISVVGGIFLTWLGYHVAKRLI